MNISLQTAAASPTLTRGPLAAASDAVLLVAERLARQVFWSCPRLRTRVRKWTRAKKPAVQAAGRGELNRYLREIGVCEGALVMVHTSVTGLRLSDAEHPNQAPPGFAALAAQLVDDLLRLIGPTGTLVMPSHAAYQQASDDAGSTGAIATYDPKRTPCAVGVANELFWRRKGVLRSLHPYNTLAAIGPLAAELLRDNLNDQKPLPHGIYSGYYRFCQMNGLVLSIGVPLGRCLTLLHAAEEARDGDWPIRDFFVERAYIVRNNGEERTWTVRQRRDEYGMFSLCLRKLHRDLLMAGVLHEGQAGTVRVDWARSKEVFDFLMARNSRSPYPYYWPRPARRQTQPS